MKRRTLLAGGIAAASLAAPALRAQSTTEVKVLYSIPDLFKTLHEQIAAEFMKANPQYKITFLAPQPAYEEIAQADPARGRHQHPARRRLSGPQPAAHLLRSRAGPAARRADRGRPRLQDLRPFARPARCRPLRRQAARHRLLGVDADHLLQRRPRDQGGRRSRRAAGRLGRHLRARRARSRRWAAPRRASTSTGTSPATGCGRRWSSPTAAPC